MTEPNWLSPAAFERLTAELEHLKGEGRLHIAERLAVARSHGDIRENGDYEAAKHEQGMMEARIRQLSHLLQNSEVREATQSGVVEVGSVVTVRTEEDEVLELLLGSAENRVVGLRTTSPTSPLGSALLGAGVGDTVAYTAPGGKFSVTVESIRPL